MPNDATTGTTNNMLAKLVAAGAILAGTGDTAIPTYIVATGQGVSGNAQLAVAGQVPCNMDVAMTYNEGAYVVASGSTGGDCSAPTTITFGTWIVGQVAVTTTTTAANQPVPVLAKPGYRELLPVSALSNAAGTILATAAASLNNTHSGDVVSIDSSGNVQDSGLVASNMVSSCPFADINSGTATSITTPANGTTRVYGFYLPCAVTTSNLNYAVTTADNTADLYDLGIYNNSGTLMVHTGAIAGTTLFPNTTQPKTVAWATGGVLLVPGRYYFAITCNTCGAQLSGANLGTFSSAGTGPSPTSNHLQSGSMPTDSWAVQAVPTFLLR
jgi:hypothetical protein